MLRIRKSDHPAFASMLSAARTTGLPKVFLTDLSKHDRSFLAELPRDRRFLWCLYEDGTHLLNEGAALQTFEAIAREGAFAGQHWYAWDGSRFSALDIESARNIVRDWRAFDPRPFEEREGTAV